MSETITEVNKDTFWTLIDQAKEHQGGPNEWLMEQLMDLGPEQAKKFDTMARVYMDLAYQYGLWTAASVMGRYGCSDDGFIDFRTWLVAQGRAVYMAALKDPDSLADAPNYQDQRFDSLPHMGDHAYEELTGREAFQDFDPDQYQALKLYTALRVDVSEADGSPMELPDPDAWMDEAGRKRFNTYHSTVLAAIQADPPQKDVTSLFKSDFMSRDGLRETGEKIDSMIQTVEDVEGKFFGVTVCQVRGKLDDMDMVLLTEYCRTLHDENAEVKRYHCPANESHRELSVHIWRDRSRFMLTEQEMARAPWRKPKQKRKGGDAR